jgi:hypothetical protein
MRGPVESGARRVACLVAVVVAVVGLLPIGRLAGARLHDGDVSAQYTTWIENRASHVFDRGTPQLRGLQAGYRVDAHILLPLGFTSIELWKSPGVGTAVASYHDCAAESGDVLRAFELFSSSDPAHAHGFDRRGFFREALKVTPAGVAWTAYFGAMTSWPEKTLSEARKSVNGPQPHTYEAIDGLSAPLETQATIFDVATTGKVADPGALWSAVRPQLESKPPRTVGSVQGAPNRPLPAFAFLGALQASLRSAAAHRNHPLAPAATRIAFTHNGSVRQLELSKITPAPTRGRKAAAEGLARHASDVFEMRYRILNPGDGDGQFTLWAELPPGVVDEALTPPLAPLGWELQLRAYLKLVFERTR